MWQRFSEEARRVVFHAQEEAQRLGESYVSTEHLLLGLCRDAESVAARVLSRLGIGLERVRSEIEPQVGQGDGRPGRDMQLTPRARRVIDLAYDEARQLNTEIIGTEHLLLALIREGESVAGRVLAKLGADQARTRAEVLTAQGSRVAADVAAPGAGPSAAVQRALDWVRDDRLGLKGASLLSMTDLSAQQLAGALDVAQGMAEGLRADVPVLRWSHPRALACIFEKPSLRTRVTFELGFQQMGGVATVLGPAEIGLGTRESVPDVARCLGRWVDAIMARVFDHQALVQLRDHAGVPVVNGLSDREHPCQALADLLTLRQKKGKLEGLKLAWVGDGNNVLHSLMLGGALAGMRVAAACPAGYEPAPDIVERARALAGDPAHLSLSADPAEAVRGADAVYADTWISMGDEAEADVRRRAFAPYQVNAALMAQAGPEAVFMHCLPAHRGEEVTDEVMDGPRSVIYDQAENRLHAQKAVLALLIGP